MTTTNLLEAVCIWADQHGERNDDGSLKWIVSHDKLDDRGRADTTHTLTVCSERNEALADARTHAARLGLPIYENDEAGQLELIEAAAQ